MRYSIIFILTYTLLLQSVSTINAYSENCPLNASSVHIPLFAKLERFIDSAIPFFLMDPSLQINFRIRQAKKRIQKAESVSLSNPSYTYQEALRAVHQTTLLEKPLRAISYPEKIPYTDIYNMLDVLSADIQKLEQIQNKSCVDKYKELSDFISRNRKTIKKIHYESLLIPTKENYSKK